MVGVAGLSLTADERERLSHPAVGGVLLFARNYDDPEQLTALVSEIHALRDPPLLVAVDQEGGRVQRFREGFTRLPPMAALGRWYGVDRARGVEAAWWAGWLMASELRSVGVDFSFAPVLDLDRGISSVVADRAFHGDPAVVAEIAGYWLRGVRSAGMAAIGKHFPGHGGCAPDSHVDWPVDDRPLAALEASDLGPFRTLMADGLTGLMPAHVVFPRIAQAPVGFSRWWIADYLRGELSFQGPVISDDLGMRAAEAAGALKDRVQACLDAGCDMAIVANEANAVDRVLPATARADTQGAQRRERLRPTPTDAIRDRAAMTEARQWVRQLARYG